MRIEAGLDALLIEPLKPRFVQRQKIEIILHLVAASGWPWIRA
jgi:hypothetical protein